MVQVNSMVRWAVKLKAPAFEDFNFPTKFATMQHPCFSKFATFISENVILMFLFLDQKSILKTSAFSAYKSWPYT